MTSSSKVKAQPCAIRIPLPGVWSRDAQCSRAAKFEIEDHGEKLMVCGTHKRSHDLRRRPIEQRTVLCPRCLGSGKVIEYVRVSSQQ